MIKVKNKKETIAKLQIKVPMLRERKDFKNIKQKKKVKLQRLIA